jgi:hypothetical protein
MQSNEESKNVDRNVRRSRWIAGRDPEEDYPTVARTRYRVREAADEDATKQQEQRGSPEVDRALNKSPERLRYVQNTRKSRKENTGPADCLPEEHGAEYASQPSWLLRRVEQTDTDEDASNAYKTEVNKRAQETKAHGRKDARSANESRREKRSSRMRVQVNGDELQEALKALKQAHAT